MEKLIQYFQHLGFADDEVAKIAHAFTRKEMDKGDFFVQEEKTSRSFAFLEQGMLQYYSTDAKGDERTTYVSLPGTFVASLLSFLNEIPARENIRALTPAVLWTIAKDDFNQLKRDVPNFKDFYIGLLEWQICCIDKGKFDLITLSAEERYEKLLREEPDLLQQVPLQYIASMIGVTPRHLSRLRAKP